MTNVRVRVTCFHVLLHGLCHAGRGGRGAQRRVGYGCTLRSDGRRRSRGGFLPVLFFEAAFELLCNMVNLAVYTTSTFGNDECARK